MAEKIIDNAVIVKKASNQDQLMTEEVNREGRDQQIFKKELKNLPQ